MSRRFLSVIGLILLAPAALAEPPRTDRFGDPLPAGALLRLAPVKAPQTDAMTAIAFAPDGKTLATGSEDDRLIRLWDLTGQEIRTLRGDQDDISYLAFSAAGQQLA